MRSMVCDVPLDAGMNLDRAQAMVGNAIDSRTRLLVTFVNPHASYLAADQEYLAAIREMDLVLCDGIGMALAATILTGLETRRVSFDNSSLAPFVFRKCSATSTPVILVGGKPGVAEHAASTYRNAFAGLNVAGVFTGYGTDLAAARQAIQSSPGAVVIAGLGARHQERFLLEIRDTPWHGVGFTCGGFMDQSLYGPKYYPDWVDRMNIRFLYRLTDEPGRLWRRYFIEYQPFVRKFMPAAIGSLAVRLRTKH